MLDEADCWLCLISKITNKNVYLIDATIYSRQAEGLCIVQCCPQKHRKQIRLYMYFLSCLCVILFIPHAFFFYFVKNYYGYSVHRHSCYSIKKTFFVLTVGIFSGFVCRLHSYGSRWRQVTVFESLNHSFIQLV